MEEEWERLVITNRIDHIISQSVRLRIRPYERHEFEIFLIRLAKNNKGMQWRFSKLPVDAQRR